MFDWIGNIIILIGIIFIIFGIYGIFRFSNFYNRILIAAKVDTVGFITILIGVIIKQGFSFFSLKVILIILLMLIVNPLTTHYITRSAYLSGYRIKNEDEEEKQ